MPHSPEDKKRILTRVRRIRGQVDALERALESGEPCLAILQQIAAVRGASNGLMGEMVEIHLKDELVNGETTSDQRAVSTSARISAQSFFCTDMSVILILALGKKVRVILRHSVMKSLVAAIR